MGQHELAACVLGPHVEDPNPTLHVDGVTVAEMSLVSAVTTVLKTPATEVLDLTEDYLGRIKSSPVMAGRGRPLTFPIWSIVLPRSLQGRIAH